MAINYGWWQTHEQGTAEGMNRTMLVVCDTIADLNAIEPTITISYDTGDEDNPETRVITTSGLIAYVLSTGDTYRMNEQGTMVLIASSPRYLSPSNTATFTSSVAITKAVALTPHIAANVGQQGFAWVPIGVSGEMYLKGNVAVRFNVTATDAIACPITATTADTVKLMYKVSPLDTVDFDPTMDFEGNGYTPLYTLPVTSSTITSRLRLFGTTTTGARYYNFPVSRGERVHFAWYLEKTTSTNTHLRFGVSATSNTGTLVRDNTLSNALSGVRLERDRTRVEVGLTSEIMPDTTKRYSVIVPEPGTTFNPASPNTNVDYITFNGSDVSYDTTVGAPLASKWVIEVANVESDLNLSSNLVASSWTGGEIRVGNAGGTGGHGFDLDGVEIEVRASGQMTGEAFD